MSVLSSPHFHDEAKAFEYLESVVWAEGVVCPHCGVVDGRAAAQESSVSTVATPRHATLQCCDHELALTDSSFPARL